MGRFVSTSLGKAELERVQPSTDRAWLEETLAETAEAMEYSQSAGGPSSTGGKGTARLVFQNLPDAAEALARISIEGASLEAREILDIIQWLERASESRIFLLSAAERFPKESTIPFNLACYAAQSQQPVEAWNWLLRAAEAEGDRKAIQRQALADPDLEALWPRIKAELGRKPPRA